MLVFIGFVLILLLVIAHEAGHFFAARRNGIEVEEFGVGFPPRAKVLTKKNGTEYTVNWLPLGGFVKLKGEHDSDTEPGSFGAAKLSAKVKVMLAGVGMNFLIAYILFTIIALIGMPQLVDNQFTVDSDSTTTRQDLLVSSVAEDSPASGTEIKDQDKILSVTAYNEDCLKANSCESKQIYSLDDLNKALEYFESQKVVVATTELGSKLQTTKSSVVQLLDRETVETSRAETKACLELRTQDSTIECEPSLGYLGIVPSEFKTIRSTWSAPVVGAGLTVQFTKLTFQGLWGIISGLLQGDTTQATEQVSGVVGVGYIFSSASFLGPVFMLLIVAVISLSLAIMNLLPIPALDGGRLFVTLLYRAMRKPLTQTAEERIHGTGFVLLMVLFVLITIVDVNRFIL